MSTKTTFKEFIITLKAIENQIKDLQDEADAIKDLIKEELTTEGIDEVMVDDFKIIYRDVISNRFDSTSFKKSHAELYKEFTKTTTYKRLTIN
jgi:predicted phage-related endonuclease